MASNANIVVGEYRLEPIPGSEKLAIDVKKAGTKIILTVTGSSNVENVTVSFQADVFNFIGATKLPVRLPFILSRELIEVAPESHKLVSVLFLCITNISAGLLSRSPSQDRQSR